MPSFADNPNIRVIQNPRANLQAVQAGQPAANAGGYYFNGLQIPQGFGGSNAGYIQNMAGYQQQLAQYQQQQAARLQDQRQFSLSGGFDPGPTRQMNAVERGLKKGSDFTQGLVNMTGWDPSKGFTPGNILRFGASLPFQMAQGVTEGSEQLYEAATGRPLLQADSETGLIGTNTLDASQRAADVANAAINIGGLFTGGSARAIGTGANILSKGKAGARMAEGMFGRAMKSPVGQVAYDVAEEGGEEFVQQYLDDTRMKNLDGGTLGRAIEGAKWGALGGGMMSGGSLALRKTLGRMKNSENQIVGENVANDGISDPTRISWVQSGNDDYRAMQQSGGDTRYMTETEKQQADDMSGSRRRRAGSVTVLMSYADNSLRKHQIRPGSGGIRAMWLDGRDSQETLMRAFRTNDEALMRSAILENTVDGITYERPSQALDALKQKTLGNQRLIIGVGRNPDTKNGGFYMEVVGFNDGDGMDIHPWVAPLVGSDFDGDRATMYWNIRDVHFNGFPVDMMRNPEGYVSAKGASYADWHYAFLEKGLANKRSQVRDKINEIVVPYYTRAGRNEEEINKKVDDWTDRFIEYNSMSDDDKDMQAGQYSTLFTEINDEISSLSGDRFDGLNAVDDITSAFETGVRDRVNDIFRDVAERRDAIAEVYGPESEIETYVREKGLDPIINRGSLGIGVSRPVQIYSYIGGIVYAITGKGNPFFRQYSMFSFNVHDHQAWVTDLKHFAALTKDESVFQTLIKASFKLTALGEDPLEAIEGLIQATVVSRTLVDFEKKHAGGKIRNKQMLDDFLEIYIGHYNELCKIYNDSKDVMTPKGLVVPGNEYIDKLLDGRTDPAFVKKFKRTFSNTVLSEFLDKEGMSEEVAMMTLDEFATKFIEDSTLPGTSFILMEDTGVQKFMNSIVKVKQAEKNGLRTSLDGFFADACPRGLLDAIEIHPDGSVTLKSRLYEASYFAYIDGLAQIVGVKNALNAGLYGLEILGTRLGQALVDKNVSVRKNAAICISLRAQYDEAIELFHSEDEQEKQIGIYLLDELSHVDNLHAVISEDIKRGGTFFDAMTTLDKSLLEKEAALSTLSERMDNGDYHIYDAFQDESGELAFAGMSDRIRKANNCMVRATKALMLDERRQAKEICSLLAGSIPGRHHVMLPQYFVRMLNKSVTKTNIDLIGLAIYDSTTVGNAAKEKARQFSSGTQTWSTMELAVNGGFMSFLDKNLSLPNRTIDVDDFVQNRELFLACLADPDFSIRLADPKTGKNCWISRDAIIREAGGDPNNGWDAANISAVVTKFPQVLGWISDPTIDPLVTADGMSTAQYAQQDSFMNGYNNYLDARSSLPADGVDPTFKDQVDEIKEALELELLNETWYRSYITRCIEEIDTVLTLPELVKITRKIHEEAVNGFFALAIAGEGTSTFKSLRSGFLLDTMNEQLALTKDFLDFVNGQLATFSRFGNASRNFSHTLSNIMAHAAIAYDLHMEAQRMGIKAEAPRILDGSDESLSSGEEGASDVVTDEIERAYEDIRTLIGVFALALDKESKISFDPSEDSRGRFQDWIDSLDIGGTEEEAEAKRARLEEVLEEKFDDTNAVFNFGDPDPNILTENDAFIDSRTNLVALRKIWSDKIHGIRVASQMILEQDSNGRFIKDPEIEEQLDEIFRNPNRAKIMEELKELRIVYNNQYLSYKLKSLSSLSGVSINPNAYLAQTRFLESFEKFVDGEPGKENGLLPLRRRLEEKTGKSLSSADWNDYLGYKPPVPNFLSTTAEGICGQLFNMDNSGFVEPAVSSNGAKTKQMQGFGYLPSDRIGKYTEKNFEELKEIYESEQDKTRHHVILNGTPIAFENLSTVAAMYERYQFASPEEKAALSFLYFDPEDNPHGIDDSNTPAPYSLKHAGYKRFRGIIGRIIDDSQEGQVLKAKKSLKPGGKIAIKWVGNHYHAEFNSKRKVTDIDPNNEYAQLSADLLEVLKEYRKEFIDGLVNGVFENELKDQGFGYEEALIIAQGLTPGFVITVLHEDGKTTSQHVLDASHLWNEISFKQRMDKIAESGTIITAEVLSITPAEASYKISRAVANESRENKDATVGYMHDVAHNAMSNWDDYEIGTLSISDVMHQLASNTYSRYSPLVASDWRTKMMYALDEITGSRGWANPRIQSLSRSTNVEPATPFNYSAYSVAIEFGKRFYIKSGGKHIVMNRGGGTPLMRAFLSKTDFISDVGDRGNFNKQIEYAAKSRGVDRDSNGNVLQMNGMACICDNEDMVEDAIRWGETTTGIVYFTKSVYEKKLSNNRYIENRGTVYTNIGEQETELVMTMPSRDWSYRRQEAMRPKGSRGKLRKSEIKVTLHDEEGTYGLGDANLYFLEPMFDFSRPVSNGYGIKCSDLFTGRIASGEVKIASAAKTIEVIDAFINNDDSSKIDPAGLKAQDKRSIPKEDLKVLMRSYRAKLLAQGDQDSVIKKDVSANDIVGFVQYGENITPIFAPKNCPKRTLTLRMMIGLEDAEVKIFWGGIVGFDTDSSTMKMAEENAPGMKMTGTPAKIPRDKCPYLPNLDDSRLEGQGEMLDMIIDQETEGSRGAGFELQTFARDVWMALRFMGGSLLYERGEDGYKVRDIKNVNPNDLLASYWIDETHGAFLSGIANFVDKSIDHADEMNAACRKVLWNCKLYRLNINEIFSTYNLEGQYAIDNDLRTEYMMAFDGMGPREIAWFAHAMNPQLINAPGTKADGSTLMDTRGRTKVYIDGEPAYRICRWGDAMDIGDESSLFTPTGSAKYSPQHEYRRGADIGYAGDENEKFMDTEWRDAIRYSDYLLGNHKYLSTRKSNDVLSNDAWLQETSTSEFDIERYKNDTWSELLHRRRERDLQKHRTDVRRVYDGPKSDPNSIIENPMEDERIKRAVGELVTAYPEAANWNWTFIMMEVDRIDGYTKTTEENHMVDIGTVKTCIEQLTSDIESGMPIQNHVTGGRTKNNRFCLAALSNDEIDIYWKLSDIRALYSSKQEFKDAVLKNARKCLEQARGITDDKPKKRALLMAYDIDFRAHGIYNVSEYIANGISLEDLALARDRILAGLMQTEGRDEYSIDPDEFRELSDREAQSIVDLRGKYEATNWARFAISRDENGRAIAKIKAQDGTTVNAVLNSATELSKIMALLNPLVFESNLLDRYTHQGIMRFAIWLGNSYHIGPYSSKNVPDAGAIELAVNSELFIEIYSALRMAMLTGEDLQFLQHAKTVQEVREWKADRLSKMTPGQKIAAQVYNIQTGGNKAVKGQARNMLYRFAQFAEANPEQAFWFKKDDSGATLFESMISNNDGDGAANWLVQCLGGSSATPSFTILMQAINSAMEGDMAQRNTLAMVLEELCRTSPLAKLVVTSTISRFPAYSLNVTNRMLNWILPMSSIYYVFTERMAEHGHKKAARVNENAQDKYVDPHYELAQVHRSLKEAMLVDITHLGVGAVAMILVGMSGGIEPPDDEKKWGNTDEWLICGMRVGSAWWIQDILGIALPLAAFTKSAQLGKPRMDILVNGITDACCSNPIIKIADAVGFINDPDGSLTAEYDRDYDQYQKAKGGAPGITDWLYGKGIGFGLNWVSQFFTPSFVRELYQNSQQWERSYKRVYQTNPDGSLSEAGKQGYTEYTTFIDSQIRRATRRNPMLGFLADLVLRPTTGYLAGEMPITVYTDDYQREAGEYWSINGLEPVKQQAKILEIICEIQKYDSMDDLAATGFYLDNETRAALGSTCWDIINEWDNWYYNLQSDGMFDYYVLGNGDFNLGQQRAADIKLEWQNQKQAWSDFYYQRVRKLPTSMTTYNRYNTTYEKDVYGEVYATGYRPSTFMPFISAPGTTTNPEGTSGYENDFMTPSAVTGLPLNQRALVPTQSYGEEMPALETWSGDGNGNGYSKLYESWYGTDGTTNEGSVGTLSSNIAGVNTSSSAKKATSGRASYSRRRSSGSGGRRRSSGGGGGYSNHPSIYARYQAPYATDANVMGRVNHSKANFDYLRPSFETKGSRESYKREDI